MKRLVAIILMLTMIMLLPACGTNAGKVQAGKVSKGMSAAAFKDVIEGKVCFRYIDLAFYETTGGKFEVARFNAEYTAVEEVRSFSKLATSRTAKSLESLKKGMTIWEVVEKVGLPDGSGSSGMITLEYIAKNGDYYWIYWDRSSGEWLVDTVINMTKENSPA